MADPLTIGGLIIVIGGGIRGGMQNPGATLDAAGRAIWDSTPTVFPVGPWQDYLPTRSQEYRAADHHGCDIMYPRTPGGGSDTVFPANSSNGTSKWFMPNGVNCYAVKDGYIWSSGTGPTGKIVVIDHGAPFASVYIHMDSLVIPEGIASGSEKIPIKAGDVIGTIGFSPRDAAKLKHLHFEVWYKGGAESHIDPWPLIQSAPLPEG